jgi:hypothetical protein
MGTVAEVLSTSTTIATWGYLEYSEGRNEVFM